MLGLKSAAQCRPVANGPARGSVLCRVASPSPSTPPLVISRSKGTAVQTDVAAVILGGGEGDSRRLFPLTEKRTLPAIPLGATYRLIDVAMSNCINSHIYKIYVLTQYNSTSLNKYLTRTYNLGGGVPIGGDGFMEVVAATQSPTSQRWSDGAADTVRAWMGMLDSNKNRSIHDVLVLPSDQVYRIDFSHLVSVHRENHADITIVCREVDKSKAQQFGMVRMDKTRRILEFVEKPKGEDVASMSMDWAELDAFLDQSKPDASLASMHAEGEDDGKAYIASCGMYCFTKNALTQMLEGQKSRDFGREIIPEAIKKGLKVMAYHMDSFWEDIGGSIADFHSLNIRLASSEPPFTFSGPGTPPFYAGPNNLSPSQVNGCKVKGALFGSGSVIQDSEITNSIIGTRSIIGRGCKISESVIMGADYYESEKEWGKAVGPNFPHIGLGENCVVHKAIIDKNARIGKDSVLVNKEKVWESMDRIKGGLCIRDGIIIVSKSSVLPDGTTI